MKGSPGLKSGCIGDSKSFCKKKSKVPLKSNCWNILLQVGKKETGSKFLIVC